MHHHVSPPCPDGTPPAVSPRLPVLGDRGSPASAGVAALRGGDAVVGAVPGAPRGLLPRQRWHPAVTFGDAAPRAVLGRVMRWPSAGGSGCVAGLPGGSEG